MELHTLIANFLRNKNDLPPFEFYFKDYLHLIENSQESSKNSLDQLENKIITYFKENPELDTEMKAEGMNLLKLIYCSDDHHLNSLAKPTRDLNTLYEIIR
jgi:hypothetical protein